jgi:hypothetical protein
MYHLLGANDVWSRKTGRGCREEVGKWMKTGWCHEMMLQEKERRCRGGREVDEPIQAPILLDRLRKEGWSHTFQFTSTEENSILIRLMDSQVRRASRSMQLSVIEDGAVDALRKNNARRSSLPLHSS